MWNDAGCSVAPSDSNKTARYEGLFPLNGVSLTMEVLTLSAAMSNSIQVRGDGKYADPFPT